MLDGFRYRLGYRAALRAERKRTVVEAAPEERGRVLVLLPSEEALLLPAWGFIQSLGVAMSDLVPVSTTGRVPYAPDAFAGGVRTLSDDDLDWRRLPRQKTAEALWAPPPTLALDLTPDFDLPAAYLIGASPARFRVGLHSPEAEPFFDLLIAPTAGYAEALQALRRYLGAVEPSGVHRS